MAETRKKTPNDTLTLKQRFFVDAYLSCGQNGRQAYLKLHPKAKPESADVLASKILALVKVRAEIEHRMKYSFGITKEQIEEDLLWVRDHAKATGDGDLMDRNAMNRAKLAGFLVEKREIKTLSDEEQSAVRTLVAKALQPVDN